MIKKHWKKIQYYFWATYRRKKLDELLELNKHYYKGVVLDIGGRDRGKFEKPKSIVEKWIFADINKQHNPDIILDVSNMTKINDKSVDVINAIELFEHVEKPEKGIKECYRVLKDGGTLIISVPFLFPIHSDPFDFQRWTEQKWRNILKKNNFEIITFLNMGGMFTLEMEIKKEIIKKLPFGIKHLFLFFYPLFDLLVKLDRCNFVKNNKNLNRYTTGYFIILKKKKE